MNHKHHHLERLLSLKSELGELYVHLVIQALATSAIAIFVPIHLLKIGFPLSGIFVFLFIQWTVYSLFAPLAGLVINRIGIKEVIFIRTILMTFAFFLLSIIKNFPQLHFFVHISAILLGMAAILYGLSIYALFTKFMHKDRRGKETNRFLTFTRISVAVGPFVGGIVSLQWGFEMLALSVSFIMLISTLPLLLIKKNVNHPRFHLASFVRHLKTSGKPFFYFNIYGIKVFLFYVILPISLYLSGQNMLSLGIIVTLVTLIGMIITKIIGHIADKNDSALLLRAGAIITSVFLLIFGLLLREKELIFLALFSGLIAKFIDIPFETYVFSKAKQCEEPVSFFTFKEFSVCFGRSLLLIVLIIFADNMEYSFYFGAATTLLFRFF